MIPLISIANLVNAAVTVVIAAELVARSRRIHHDGLKYLAAFFVFFVGFWAFRATPGLIVFDPSMVMVTNLVSYVFMFMATTSLLQVPFIFLGRGEWGAVLGILNVVAGIVFVLGRIFNAVPHPAVVIQSYVFWQETYAPWLRAVSGLSSLIATSIFVGIFFSLGYQDRKNTIVYRRSMHLAGGMALVMCAAAAFFLLSLGGFWVSVFASTTCIVGLFLMLRGIVFEIDQPTTITPPQPLP